MADLKKILLLGDPRLYNTSSDVKQDELPALMPIISELGDLVSTFRMKYARGRAIAAPQIGVFKRIIVLNIERPLPIINPVLHFPDHEMFEIWDDCMSFPNLLVRLKRYRKCTLNFKDIDWHEQKWHLEDDMSELMQHEYDHLDGILATQRAINDQSFRFIAI